MWGDSHDLPLPDADVVADVEQEEDPGRVRSGLRALGGLLRDTSTGALGKVLGSVAMNLLS
jgi:hypothetical protein